MSAGSEVEHQRVGKVSRHEIVFPVSLPPSNHGPLGLTKLAPSATGELLKAMAQSGERAGRGRSANSDTVSHLADLGIDAKESERYQQAAGKARPKGAAGGRPKKLLDASDSFPLDNAAKHRFRSIAKVALDRVMQGKHGGDRVSKGANSTLDPNQRGTTEAYALRRLRKERPELHAAVLRGEQSAHAAAIEAGFRKRTVTVALDHRDLSPASTR